MTERSGILQHDDDTRVECYPLVSSRAPLSDTWTRVLSSGSIQSEFPHSLEFLVNAARRVFLRARLKILAECVWSVTQGVSPFECK